MPPPAQLWWAVPEGTIGQWLSIAGGILTGRGGASLYHVVRQTAKPASSPGNPVYGPFPSQAAAQARCDELNGIASQAAAAGEKAAGVSNPLAGISAAIGSLTSWATRGFAIRALKVVAGVALVIVGLVQLTHAQTLITNAAQVAGKVPV